MEKREEALREALATNAEETARWNDYQNENKTAIENLEKFSKHLTVDVMVPIGRKAFMPGKLLHTNEVLVGHYQSYFSKCSAHKAKEICELRVRNAEEHLKNLKAEEDLWQNKLEKPYLDGVIPTGNQQEIIEDYDEEQEKLWREKHLIRLKQAKLKEKQGRQEEIEKQTREKTDEEILKLLEEAELLEELEQELETIEIDDISDETIKQLMAGNMQLPKSKPRIAHNENINVKNTMESDIIQGVVKKSELNANVSKPLPTNNNTTPNPDITIENIQHDNDDDIARLPDEIITIKNQAKYLPAADQIGFYEYQLQIVREKMRSYTKQQYEEKMKALEVIELLEDLLDEAERYLGDQELAEYNLNNIDNGNMENDNISAAANGKETESASVENPKLVQQQKRRISFALEDQTLEFRKNETVSQMLPKPAEKSTENFSRDIIVLDEPLIKNQLPKTTEPPAIYNKQESILAKVKNNMKYVAEHQSIQHCDLVNQIINESEGKCYTLNINFKHSQQQPTHSVDRKLEGERKPEENIPNTPADIYTNYLKCIDSQKDLVKEPTTFYVNSYEGEDEVRVPVLREVFRQQAFEDPKIKFSQPSSTNHTEQRERQNTEEKNLNETAPTSILRNKEAVAKERHTDDSVKSKKKKKKPVKPVDENEYMSAYYKVMNDVVENPITEPDALPKVPYIDAHAPKKRISRFKQMRAGIENT